jgi:Uncharacterized protein conserved in bacteria (DUF2334)
MTQILLRYDDYSTISNLAIERELFEAVSRAGARLSVAIVPFVADVNWGLRGPIPLMPLSAEKVSLFKEYAHCLEPLLHGYAHQTVSRWSGLSEFNHAITLEVQVARLADAKAFLESQLGVAVKTFVPPWNTYTAETLEALKRTGFECLSGANGHGAVCENLFFVPGTCSLTELPAAMQAASQDAQALVPVLFHEYDFKESKSPLGHMTIRDLEQLLNRAVAHGGHFIDFAACRQGFDKERALANQSLDRAMASPFRKLFKRGTRSVYWNAELAQRKMRTIAWLNRLKP